MGPRAGHDNSEKR